MRKLFYTIVLLLPFAACAAENNVSVKKEFTHDYLSVCEFFNPLLFKTENFITNKEWQGLKSGKHYAKDPTQNENLIPKYWYYYSHDRMDIKYLPGNQPDVWAIKLARHRIPKNMQSKSGIIARLKIVPATSIENTLNLQCEETFITVIFDKDETDFIEVKLGMNAI